MAWIWIEGNEKTKNVVDRDTAARYPVFKRNYVSQSLFCCITYLTKRSKYLNNVRTVKYNASSVKYKASSIEY